MAKNNRRNGRGDSEPSGAPRWVVFMGGVTTGVLATVVAGALMWPRSGIPEAPAADSPAIAQAKRNDDDITYEYEPMLRNSEVPVEDAAAVSAAAPIVSTAPARVVLQAGSFRAASDADNMRAQLLLLDIGPVTTREALVKDGEVWHRVFIGPFANEQALRKARDKLMQQNISTFSIAAPTDMPLPAANDPAAKPAAGNRPAANTPAASAPLAPRTAVNPPSPAKPSAAAPATPRVVASGA